MLKNIKNYLSVQDLAVRLIVSSFNNPDFEKIWDISSSMSINPDSYSNKIKEEYNNGNLSEEQFTRLYAALALMKASNELMDLID